MKPFVTLARSLTPDGLELTLQEHDGHFYLKLNGRQLMSTMASFSESFMAELACNPIPRHENPRLLIGGLGFGFTLRTALELLNPNAKVEVAEVFREIVQWNRTYLKHLNGMHLDDPRVQIRQTDVFDVLKSAPKAGYDAILLDVDNGPIAFSKSSNSRIYDTRGLNLIARALKPGGQVLFWSASEDRPFQYRLQAAGFEVKVHEAKSYPNAKRAAHRIYVGGRSSPQACI